MTVMMDTADLQDIRQLVLNELTSKDLPDDVINRDIYLGIAERDIFARANITSSQYDALDAEQQTKIKTAVKYKTAVLILPSLPQLLRETVIGISYQYNQLSQTNKIKRYEDLIDNQVPKVPEVVDGSNTYLSYAGVLPGR